MLRFFTSDLRRNIIKIVCLTLGLAIGFLLVAKVYFEETYDTFFPDSDRIFRLNESVEMNGEYREYNHTPGGIAPALKRYSPLVESATRLCHLYYSKTRMQTEDGFIFETDKVLMTDSCFFDVLQTEIIAGNPKEALTVKGNVMIPLSIAKKIGGDVMGKELSLPDGNPDIRLKIDGIYKDFPLNSSIPNAVYLSLPSIDWFMYDGRDNWMGNDNYSSYIKLLRDVKPEQIQPHVSQMLHDNIDEETLEMTNFNIKAIPLVGDYVSDETVKTTMWILSVLAIVMLMCAGLNYLLITIGQIGTRSKEMAIRKCYGTSNAKIFARVICESLFFLVISMGLAILLVFCFSDTCQQLLGCTPSQLLTTKGVWIAEFSVCLALLLVTGFIPAWIYCRTPVAHSFSSKLRSRKGWKLALLAVQFFASSLLICMLALVGRQFSHLTSIDIGTEYEKLGLLDLSHIPQSTRTTLVNELKTLSVVEGVSSADSDFLFWSGGNNVWINDDVEKEVNITDLYYANRDIIEVMGMKLLEGTTFDETPDSTSHQVIVEENFYDVLRKAGRDVEKGHLVGESFRISEHSYDTDGGRDSEYTICGVVGNMKRGGVENRSADGRAALFFNSQKVRNNLFIRFSTLNPENLKAAQEVVKRVVTEKERYILPYRERVMSRVEPVKRFGLSIIVIGISILVIAMIGLVGYVSDEVQFRAKEVAIRKVSGYSARQIVKLFIADILKIAIPATILGGIVAIPVGRKWISQFADQTSLSPGFNVLLIILLLIIIACVVALNTLSIARDNPVKHLHRE